MGQNCQNSGATLGFETKLWEAADALRNNMDAAEYKHVVLGLVFLKYISDAFNEKHAQLEAEKAQGADRMRLTRSMPSLRRKRHRAPIGCV